MKIPNIKNISFKPFLNGYNKPQSIVQTPIYADSFNASNYNFDKTILIKRGIIEKDEDLFEFFDNISNKIFSDKNANELSFLLKNGYVSLSTSCYGDINNPQSAKAIKLNPSKTPAANCARLEEEISLNRGIGANFSEFNNPIEHIRKINAYFKFRQNSLKRLPAGIALLNINHPQILDFITLKDNEDFKNWCFDLSVIMPADFLAKVDNNESITLSNGKKMRAKVIYHTLLNSMTKTGEPGIIFSDKKDYICDCCAVAPLKENEGLTLAHINLAKFYSNSKIDYDMLNNASDILSKALKNIDPNGYIGVLGYQTLLDKMNLAYGTSEADDILKKCLEIIKKQTSKNNIKTAISPTGGISRLLKVSPSIEPDDNSDISYYQEINTLKIAQNYMDGNISKTIILKPSATTEDADKIVRYCTKNNIKGISVYKPR